MRLSRHRARMDFQPPSQQRETLANAEQPETASVRPWLLQLSGTKPLPWSSTRSTTTFSLSRHVQMSFLDPRVFDYVDQELPYRLKSDDGQSSFNGVGIFSDSLCDTRGHNVLACFRRASLTRRQIRTCKEPEDSDLELTIEFRESLGRWCHPTVL